MSYDNSNDASVVLGRITRFSLCTLIFCLPFSNAIAEISATVAISAWIACRFITKDRSYSPGFSIFILAGYLGANLLSVFTSSNPVLSTKAFFFKVCEYALVFVVASDSIFDKNTLKKVINVIITISLILAFDGLIQFIFGFEFLRQRSSAFGVPRISASFVSPNDFASYLITIIPLMTAMLIYGNITAMGKKAFAGTILLSFICLLLTYSRSGILSFGVGIGMLLILADNRGRRRLLVASVAFTALFVFLYLSIYGKLNLFSGVETDRLKIWHIAWRMFKDRPILGHGISTFMSVFGAYKGTSYQSIVYAHNCYLQMLAETGVVGLIFFLLLLLGVFFYGFYALYKTKDTFYRSILAGMISGLSAHLFQAAFDTSLYSLPLALLFWSFLGLTVAVSRISLSSSIH